MAKHMELILKCLNRYITKFDMCFFGKNVLFRSELAKKNLSSVCLLGVLRFRYE